MTRRRDAAAPEAGHFEGAGNNLLATGIDHRNGINSDRLTADDQRLLVGSILAAPVRVRDRLFGLIAPGDLDDLLASDAVEILRVLHQDSVVEPADLVEQFAATVAARRRSSDRPGYLSWVRYPVGPLHWLASAFSDAAHLGESGAVVLALQFAGTGHRRALAEAADRLAQAARSGDADHDDLVCLVEKLLPLLDSYRAVAG